MNPQTDSRRSLAYIVGGALVLSFTIFGLFYYNAQSSSKNDMLSVTGSAKIRVTSDQAKLTLSISRTVPVSELAAGYASVAKDLSLAKTFLKQQGITDAQITDSTVSSNQIYDYNNRFAEARYELRQTITVESGDVQKLTDVSKKIPTLASQGAIVSIQSLEYTYSKLPELRVSLLGDAVKDAKSRAEKIAGGTGRGVGGIRAASGGVVQLLPPNSIEVSDYGSYDTSSIEKDVMVTVKASFGLK
jgi:uncharacterized protein